MIMNRSKETSPEEALTYRQSLYFQFAKRVVDVTASSILLILLFPLFLIISCCIKFSDPKGPVLFVQERVGLNERSFRIYKFRSMCTDAEEKLEALLKQNEVDGAMFKMKDDPRITKVGKYLRKLSLDELPQLTNVLKGDMSLVGPRPCLNREYREYSDYHKQRLLVKPGITGLWQVSGRSSLTFEQMVDLDLAYIKNSSIINDFKILFKTVFVVLIQDNAY